MPDRRAAHDDALRVLYAAAPADFLERRAELVAAARKRGDTAAAETIQRRRKPTAAAWIVNLLVLEQPSAADELADLGSQLREAQDALDATRLRELTAARRALVARLTKEAFALAGRRTPPAALRDEVTGTFDAAIADPDVAERLGHLQRAEQWSGFGFAPGGGPELTLVRGGRSDKSTRPPSAPPPPPKAVPKVSAGERRKQQRALATAQKDFAAAESAHEQARASEKRRADEVRRLSKRLSKLQSQLDTARSDLEAARDELTTTRARRRDTRSALDRAERAARD